MLQYPMRTNHDAIAKAAREHTRQCLDSASDIERALNRLSPQVFNRLNEGVSVSAINNAVSVLDKSKRLVSFDKDQSRA